MTRLNLSFLISSICLSLNAEAVIMRSLDEMQAIEVPLSQEEFTRIHVKEDRIAHVFGNRDKYLIEADEEGGQIFLKPRTPSPFSISLRTESGITQDLRLIPKEAEPEALILIKADKSSSSQTGPEISHFSREEVEALVKACENNLIPQGYVRVPLSINNPNSPYRLVREIRNAHLRGLTFKTIEGLSEEAFLKTSGILEKQIIAILITQGGLIHVVARTIP